MELLSNIIWIVVAVSLWSVWVAERRGTRGASLRSAIGAQLIALAVLTLILLPVISVSDDLQASHNPAEVERTYARNDHHLLPPNAPAPAPAALTFIISCLLLASFRTIAFLGPAFSPRYEQVSHVCALASRPPPLA